ncbi:class I SAM-dependent methyltransferase [Dankookia rubra]|uniref:Class I SAM-dependent methyltransferase n=1 Tax=Dankookia rubra TaxID=1442381 RepID=A0A4R5Q563_9PROT|nr:class I SAM-dependent methyltransferase [Dankookia rubra]TDH58054.1 class I SAM-dependent methyltransferase [Dankookia rubra]
MGTELTYGEAAAAGYDRTFAHVSARFVPALLRAARLASGMHVLDVATGTGLVAEAALAAVDPTGHVTAADISPAMAERARARLGDAPNVTIALEDGQSMSFPNESFGAVVCGLGLMFFPDPTRGLAEFRRVLRRGGRVAVSVPTTATRTYDGPVFLALARHAPPLAEATTRMFSLGDAAWLGTLLDDTGFRDVEVATEVQRFEKPSFDAYFEPYERGWGTAGQAYVALPDEGRRAMREEVRRSLGDTGGPIEIDVEIRFASGRR